METLNCRAIKFNGYKIELSVNNNNKPVARFSKLITVGKNKGTYKLIEGFYFSDESKRNDYVEKTVTRVKNKVNEEDQQAKIKQDAKNNFVNPYKIGQLFYDSWGYDQTNIDFYEIVGLKARSVVLQKIGQTKVEDAGFMCEYVKPNSQKKLGEVSVKPIQLRVHDGKIIYSINGYRGSISEYTQGDKGLYQSHYA